MDEIVWRWIRNTTRHWVHGLCIGLYGRIPAGGGPALPDGFAANAEVGRGRGVRYNLFLALKEALNNIVKHAHATEVRVGLRLENKAFTLVIQDNGRE